MSARKVGVAKSETPMKAMRMSGALLGIGLARLDQLAKDDAAPQRRQVIDHEHPVEMIHFMLNAPSRHIRLHACAGRGSGLERAVERVEQGG